MILRSRLAEILAILICATALLFGQTETGQITGVVMDASGAAVPNAKVTVKSTATGLTRIANTGDTGIYTFTNLPPGVYGITVEASGFSTTTQNATLSVGARTGIDFRLEVGRAETAIQITDTALVVNTQTQTISSVITNKQIMELPSLTRDPYDFVRTVGNVSEFEASTENNTTGGGAGVVINGMRASSTNILLDGASNNDDFDGAIGLAVPLDSVQEFSVLTSNFTAEFGRASGGIVNVVTRSGSNEFHGAGYEYNRVSRFASNTFENNANGIAKPTFVRNQFGYRIGGPIVKNKLFFFNNTEWTRVRSQATRTVWVPTQELIGQAAPNTQEFFRTLGGDLRPTVVDLGSFSRSALQAQGFDPCAGAAAAGPCNSLSPNLPLFRRLSYNYPSDSGAGAPQNTYMMVARGDWNISDRTLLYGRYAKENVNELTGSQADSPYAGYDSPASQANQSALLSLVHTFSPAFTSQSKLSFNRLNESQPLGERPAGPGLFFFPNTPGAILGANVAFPGYLPYNPGVSIPSGGPQNAFQLNQDFGVVRGSHNFRFGGAITYIMDHTAFGAYSNGVQVLANNSYGVGMDNLLRGQLFRFSAAIDPQGKYPCASAAAANPACTVTLPVGSPLFSRSNRYKEFAWYVQDSWKVTPRLTLNLGLRWEYFGVQHNKDPRLDSNFYYGEGATRAEQIRNGQVMLAPDSPVGGLWEKDLNNFAPRIGFAWDVFGDRRTSLRGGYGMGYERNFGNVTFNVIQNPPNYSVINLEQSDLPGLSISAINSGPLAGNVGSKALPSGSLRHVDQNIGTAYAHFWSGAVEHQVANAVSLGLEYTGSKGVNLYSIEDTNRSGLGNILLGDPCAKGSEFGDPGNCTARLRQTQYTGINTRGKNGFSNYNGLNTRVDVRGWNGLQLRFNWTWSHAIDNLSTAFSSSNNNFNLGLTDPFNPGLDRGDADHDARHRLAISGSYEVPTLRNANSFVKYAIGGWSIAPIFTASTGRAFTIYDTTYNAVVSTRARFSGDVPRTGNTDRGSVGTNLFSYYSIPNMPIDRSWVNPITNTTDFGPFPANLSGRNAFRAPGFWNLDLGVYKNFRVTESVNIQFRAEAYNAFNHSNMYIQLAQTDLSVFQGDGDASIPLKRGTGQRQTDERRNLQLALRFEF